MVHTIQNDDTAPDVGIPGSQITSPVFGSVFGPPDPISVGINGSATDNVGVSVVEVGVQDRITGKWWNGSAWVAGETRQAAVLGNPGAVATNWTGSSLRRHARPHARRVGPLPGPGVGPRRRWQRERSELVVRRRGAGRVAKHVGAVGDAHVDAGFVAATAGQTVETIDFDGDGLSSFGLIPPSTYAAQGVTMAGLDGRDVTPNNWSHSPPFGAEAAGYNTPTFTGAYSFTFARPVASFGLFANDVEGSVYFTVHLDDATTQLFVSCRGDPGGANVTNFFGLYRAGNTIVSIDVDSADLHIIDDVRIGIDDREVAGTTDVVHRRGRGHRDDRSAPGTARRRRM